jgi:hypothetical protein
MPPRNSGTSGVLVISENRISAMEGGMTGPSTAADAVSAAAKAAG